MQTAKLQACNKQSYKNIATKMWGVYLTNYPLESVTELPKRVMISQNDRIRESHGDINSWTFEKGKSFLKYYPHKVPTIYSKSSKIRTPFFWNTCLFEICFRQNGFRENGLFMNYLKYYVWEHMFCVHKRNVSLRRFFFAHKTYVW